MLPRSWWWGFVPYAAVSLLHVGTLAVNSPLAPPTKLLLMPLLAVGALWAAAALRTGRGSASDSGSGAGSGAGIGTTGPPRGAALALLLGAIALSWLGDGAGTFFPFAPQLPVMLGFFGLAHVCYIALFWRVLAVRRLPFWAVTYAVWWVVLLVVLWPHLGALSFEVAGYGLVLGGTAAAASRCGPTIAVGAVFFLASDTILAFRLFLPDAVPGWTSPLVMLTYCLGQGMIAVGALRSSRTRRSV